MFDRSAIPDEWHGRDRLWFQERIGEPDAAGCWLWQGVLDVHGYGYFVPYPQPKVPVRKAYKAHRVVYEMLVGPIRDGLTLDHLCRNRACVNPAHLEPVTNAENILRGESPWAQKKRQTSCIHGHAYDEHNTGRRENGTRYCRACARERMARKRAEALA